PPFGPGYRLGDGYPAAPKDLNIDGVRKELNATTLDGVLAANGDVIHSEHLAPGIAELSSAAVPVSIFSTKTSTSKTRGVVIFVHGGGQVSGNRFFAVPLHYVTDDSVVAAVEYRLAPEHRAPAGAYDCYAAAVHLSEHAAELGIDPAKMVFLGMSGGCAPAAAACLLARQMKRPQPEIRAVVLSIPMLDDREHYTSWKQFESQTIWPGRHNRAAWEAVLGPGDRTNVTDTQVPARAETLAGLPDVFIDVGECEVFRDSAIAFAAKTLADGGSCELHVWPGMYHGAYGLEPD
ncbi:alpha/beta-hydrolase, partial [Periconia macrospinosa]